MNDGNAACEFCNFWLWQEASRGECHRRAPDKFPYQVGEEWFVGSWPITRRKDWCGEFLYSVDNMGDEPVT
jgi:hypothetical protein